MDEAVLDSETWNQLPTNWGHGFSVAFHHLLPKEMLKYLGQGCNGMDVYFKTHVQKSVMFIFQAWAQKGQQKP